MTAPAQAPVSEWKHLLGVCACLSEDLGINLLLLRIGFAVALLWNPVVVFAVYGVLGIAVLASRLLVPEPKAAPAPVEAEAIAAPSVEAEPEFEYAKAA